jgi:phosphoribosylanthranilate isomerase
MIVQIYEIQTPADAEAVIERGVNHVGSVILGKESWKNEILLDTVRTVCQSSARSSLIPLFTDADCISFALDYYRPDIVHFCDAIIEDPGQWEALCGRMISIQATVRERFPEIAIMRSVPVPPPGGTLPVPMMVFARYFEPLTDYFLTDTYLTAGQGVCDPVQPVAGFIGITGQICDWGMAAQLVAESRIPVILAGGLSPDNVYDAIQAVRPAGVDSCTNTNTADGTGKQVRFKKDMDKVARFVEEAMRGARQTGAVA